MNKRQFLKTLSLAGLTGSQFLPMLEKLVQKNEHRSPQELAADEDFWANIRQGYRLKPDYINLENGYYCFIPRYILERYQEYIEDINYQGSWYMRTVLWHNRDAIRARLAETAGCEPGEIAITRNTTESLDTVIGGFPWKAGDEAVMSEQDYFSMLDMFKLQAQRHGIVNKRINVPMHPTSDEEVVNAYAQAITPKTKLLMVCHMVNITGHILPIRKICDMAHSRGVEVMVDGAHAFAHIDFKIPDLGCDYYGASLHKWLSAPLGSGLLYVKKDKIEKLWPMMAHMGYEGADIHRINHIGTHPAATDLAIGDALDYYHMIGAERKEARLRYLQEYWSRQVRELPHIQVNTPAQSQRACGIANVGIKGMKPADMADTLLKKHHIWTVAIDGAGVQGCRISPNVYTTTKELDVFVKALKEM